VCEPHEDQGAVLHEQPGDPVQRLPEILDVMQRQLGDEVWIEGAHPDCLGPLDEIAERTGVTLRVGFHCDDLAGKQALVAAGVGVTLIPGLALPTVRPDIELRRVADRLPRRRIYAAVPPADFRAPAVAPMVELLLSIESMEPCPTTMSSS